MASTYTTDKYGRQKLLHIDATAPYVTGKSGLSGGGQGQTDPLTWANQFRRNDSQITQAQLPGAIPQASDAPHSATATNPDGSALPANVWRPSGRYSDSSQPASITGGILNEIFSNPFAASIGGFGIRSGQNGQPGYTNAPAPSLTQMAQGNVNHAQTWMDRAQQGGQRAAPFMQSGSTASTTYGGTDLRKPYIGGAQGDMTNQFADRGDKTLDRNYIDRKYNNGFSFASAFR